MRTTPATTRTSNGDDGDPGNPPRGSGLIRQAAITVPTGNATPAIARPSRWQRVRQYPLTWFLFAPIILFVEALFLGPASDASQPVAVSLTAASGIAAWLMYLFVMRKVAGRATPELARRGAGRELLRGAGIGAGFVCLSVGLITLFGGYHFHAGTGRLLPVLISTVVGALAGAVAEETAFRGIGLQALERLGGSWFALIATSFLFGLAHLFNPGATVWSSVSIFIEAGVLLGAAFLWRRSLWFAIGLHTAWNAIEGLLGIPVSGHADPALARVTEHGSAWLTGGGFGMEASLIPVLISVAIATPMLIAARRAGRIR